MSFQVGHTHGGDVAILVAGGTRFDLSIELAEAAWKTVSETLETGASEVFARIDCLDDRAFRFAGSADQAQQFARDLGLAVEACRSIKGDVVTSTLSDPDRRDAIEKSRSILNLFKSEEDKVSFAGSGPRPMPFLHAWGNVLIEEVGETDVYGLTKDGKRAWRLIKSIPSEYEIKVAAAILASGEDHKKPPMDWAIGLIRAGLTDIHCGDCTKVSGACTRCIAEDYVEQARAFITCVEVK